MTPRANYPDLSPEAQRTAEALLFNGTRRFPPGSVIRVDRPGEVPPEVMLEKAADAFLPWCVDVVTGPPVPPNRVKEESMSVLDVQHGGQHYKAKGIQPIEYIQANGLNFFEGNIVKYVTRHREKKGAEDIRKLIHYAQMILEFEYGETP